MRNDIYYIGGSPCSGKSTVAEHLSREYDMYYFKVDDYLNSYLEKAANDGFKLAKKFAAMNCDQMWLRKPEVMLDDEIEYYTGIFKYVLEDLNKIETKKPIITEAAAFMPNLVKSIEIPNNRYICIIPDAGFQNSKYIERPWIEYILAESNNRNLAFYNWMKRDELFALHVQEEAIKLGYKTIITNTQTTIAENIEKVKTLFKLE